MIKYTYSKELGLEGQKYYFIEGTLDPIIVGKIVAYCDLVGEPINDALNIRWVDEIQLRDHIQKYGLYWTSIDRSILKEMRKLGIIEAEYKYKKKDK